MANRVHVKGPPRTGIQGPDVFLSNPLMAWRLHPFILMAWKHGLHGILCKW